MTNETPRTEIRSAVYGLLRMVAGHKEWLNVGSLDLDQRSSALINSVLTDLTEANASSLNEDALLAQSLTRKLRAYQQLRLLEKFCLEEIIWDD